MARNIPIHIPPSSARNLPEIHGTFPWDLRNDDLVGTGTCCMVWAASLPQLPNSCPSSGMPLVGWLNLTNGWVLVKRRLVENNGSLKSVLSTACGHAGAMPDVMPLSAPKNRGKDGLAVKSSDSVDPQARAMGRTHSWAMGSTDYSTGWVDFFVRASKFGRSWSIQKWHWLKMTDPNGQRLVAALVITHLRPQSSNDHYPYPFDDLHISAPPLLMSGLIFHNQVKKINTHGSKSVLVLVLAKTQW